MKPARSAFGGSRSRSWVAFHATVVAGLALLLSGCSGQLLTSSLSLMPAAPAEAPIAPAEMPAVPAEPPTASLPNVELVSSITDPAVDQVPFKDAERIVREIAPKAADCVPDCGERGGSLRQVKSSHLHVPFAFNSADLTPHARRQLDELARAISMAPQGWEFEIAGHTDAVGNPRFNRSLSVDRARAAARYLSEQHDIEPARLNAVGFGELHPLEGLNPRNSLNRRVEVRPIRS